MLELLEIATKVARPIGHSCYELIKDFIVPVAGSALGVFGAYYVMKNQLEVTEKNRLSLERESKQDYCEFLDILTGSTVLEVDINIKVINFYEENYKFTDKEYRVKQYIQRGYISKLAGLDEKKIHSAINEDLKTIESKRIYIAFISNASDLIHHSLQLEKFIDEHLQEIKERNSKILESFKEFVDEYSKLRPNDPVKLYFMSPLNNLTQQMKSNTSFASQFLKFMEFIENNLKTYANPDLIKRSYLYNEHLKKIHSQITTYRLIIESFQKSIGRIKEKMNEIKCHLEKFREFLNKSPKNRAS